MRTNRVLISRENLTHNFLRLQSLLPHGTRILPMIKANAYGHGDLLMANELSRLGAVGMGVADHGEAQNLRRRGYAGLILSLGTLTPETFDLPFDPLWVFTLHNLDELEVLQKRAHTFEHPLQLHVEVNTGMNRYGFDPSQISHLMAAIKKTPNLLLKGVMTHFSSSDDEDPDFTQKQLSSFLEVKSQFLRFGFEGLVFHAANSGGILFHPSAHLDWVRPGKTLFGYPPRESPEKKDLFKPILEWRATVTEIKTVLKGQTLSYNASYKVTQPHMVVATVGVGYGDGYRRNYRLGVHYNGTLCPILGNICMDSLLIDVSHIQTPKFGDEVVLLSGNTWNALDFAKHTQTITYEILTGISSRVPRILV